jgi:hypothetical protein
LSTTALSGLAFFSGISFAILYPFSCSLIRLICY